MAEKVTVGKMNNEVRTYHPDISFAALIPLNSQKQEVAVADINEDGRVIYYDGRSFEWRPTKDLANYCPICANSPHWFTTVHPKPGVHIDVGFIFSDGMRSTPVRDNTYTVLRSHDFMSRAEFMGYKKDTEYEKDLLFCQLRVNDAQGSRKISKT